jgi:adenylate cyclase
MPKSTQMAPNGYGHRAWQHQPISILECPATQSRDRLSHGLWGRILTRVIDTERRLVAIFAADVEGYSRLMGVDEVGTLRDLTQRRSVLDGLIATHRGRIANTAGDSVLAEFGSAVDAVKCAVEAQAALAEANADQSPETHINFRIGVHVGDVMIKGGDLFGDSVNIAARLQALARAGGVCISGVTHDQIRKVLHLAFTDFGVQQVKNIEEPVRVFALNAKGSSAAVGSPNSSMPLALPDRPSIAVLPFQNMSGDPEQEYFADGMVEDIVTALSRIRWLFVIARTSTFTYKSKDVDVKQVGRELGVRYVLEGSVRKGGGRVRITAQLINALTGVHLWADRYDRELTDIFAVQDEITASVATVIEPALAEAEQQRVSRKAPESLDAWEAYQRGLWHFYKYAADEHKVARTLFRRAIEIDPYFAPGHYGFALAQHLDFWLYSTLSWTEVTGSGLEEARIAVSLDDRDSMAHAVLSFMRQMSGDWEAAIAEGRTAVNLNPNSAWSMVAMGHALGWGGYQQEGIDYLRRAMRASPHDPLTWLCKFWMGIFQYFSREYVAAIDNMREVVHVRQGFANRWLAAALGQLDRTAEAKEALEKARAATPEVFERMLRQRPPWMRPEDYAHQVEGLRKAGWEG